MPKDFVLLEGKKVKFTGDVRRPRTGELYQYADGSICRAMNVKNPYPILEYIDECERMLAEKGIDRNNFWMIQADNTSSTSKRHYTHEQAVDEAKKLAGTHCGTKFHLLQTVGYFEVKKPDPTFTEVARE